MRILCFLITLLFCTNINAQQVMGTITNPDHVPVAGASIVFKSAKTSALSKTNGTFSISMPVAPDSLIITHIGYQTLVLYVLKQNEWVTAILQPSTSELSDVTVSTGYQDIPRERATGSFEKISNHALNRLVTPDILSRLEGASSILFDKNINHPSMTIRGLSSIHGPKEPLIVVNNFPYEGNLSNINPDDVETVTLLKDAAAASIWGSRAGNGVIVITTKKGLFNQPLTIDMNASIQVTEKPDIFYIPSISSSDYIDVEQFLFSKGFYNNMENSTARPALSPVVEILIMQRGGLITAAEANERINKLKTHDTRSDFNKYLYGRGINRQYSLNVKGGSNNATYLLSAGLNTNTSELAATSSRVTIRTESMYKPLKNLQLSGGITYSQTSSASGKTSPVTLRNNVWAYTALADETGNALPVINNFRAGYLDTAGAGKLKDWKYYPLEDYKYSETNSSLSNMLVNGSIQYNMGPFAAAIKYQYELQRSETNSTHDNESYFSRNLVNTYAQLNRVTGAITYIVPDAGVLEKQEATLVSQNIRAQLTFNKAWKIHRLTALAGSEARDVNTVGNTYRTYGYDKELASAAAMDFVNTYPTFITGSRQPIPNNLQFSDRTNRFVSAFANAAYTYKDRYSVTASARQDASNLFGVNSNERWNPLWSAGASWSTSSEPFYRSKLLPVLKFRLTYGFSGNADQGRSAVSTILYSINAAAGTNLPFAQVNRYVNPSLRWEKVSMVNLAADFETKNKILSGNIEYYLKKGTDLFGPSPVDYTMGLGTRSITRNVANMKGSGFDIRLQSSNINRRLKWFTSLLLNYNTTSVTRYHLTSATGASNISNGNTISALEGKPVYAVFSYQWRGLDSLGNPLGVVDDKTSSDYTAILGAKTQVQHLVYSGPALPPLFGSLNNTISFRGLSVSANIIYKLGHFFRKESIVYSQLFSQKTAHADFANRWQQPGDEYKTNVPSMVYPNNNNRDNFYNASEALVRKAGLVRLQYINVEYMLSKRQWRKSPFTNIRLYAVASNLGLLWRANKEGIDPDYGSNVPPAKSFSIGTAVTL